MHVLDVVNNLQKDVVQNVENTMNKRPEEIADNIVNFTKSTDSQQELKDG